MLVITWDLVDRWCGKNLRSKTVGVVGFLHLVTNVVLVAPQSSQWLFCFDSGKEICEVSGPFRSFPRTLMVVVSCCYCCCCCCWWCYSWWWWRKTGKTKTTVILWVGGAITTLLLFINATMMFWFCLNIPQDCDDIGGEKSKQHLFWWLQW